MAHTVHAKETNVRMVYPAMSSGLGGVTVSSMNVISDSWRTDKNEVTIAVGKLARDFSLLMNMNNIITF